MITDYYDYLHLQGKTVGYKKAIVKAIVQKTMDIIQIYKSLLCQIQIIYIIASFQLKKNSCFKFKL